jgi:hypothetical protein
MIFERDRIDHEPGGHTLDRAPERPTMKCQAGREQFRLHASRSKVRTNTA